MSNILFLLDSYFPKPSPNAICVRKIMLQLLKNDTTPACIVLDDNKKSNIDILDNINVHRINSRLPNRIIAQNSNKTNHEYYYTKIAIQLSRIQGASFALFWPLLSIMEVLRYYYKAKKIYEDEKLEVVVSVYKRIEALIAGVLLKYKYPELKFVCYTLDCMSGSLIPKIRKTNIAEYSIRRWEKYIFSKADYICIMQSHEKHYRQDVYKKFAEKFVIMDIPLFEIGNKIGINKLNNTKGKVNLVFTGSMSENTANPSYFINILEKIENIEFEFNIYGGTSSKIITNNIKNSYLYGKRLFWHGIVSPAVAANKQKEAAILLSFGNDNECMIPSKIFEYIALKKHVIHLYKSATDSAIPYFEKYGNSSLINEQENQMDENIRITKDLILNLPEFKIEDQELLNRFYNNTPKPMADFLIKLLS